jgi:hypothetical protein
MLDSLSRINYMCAACHIYYQMRIEHICWIKHSSMYTTLHKINPKLSGLQIEYSPGYISLFESNMGLPNLDDQDIENLENLRTAFPMISCALSFPFLISITSVLLTFQGFFVVRWSQFLW